MSAPRTVAVCGSCTSRDNFASRFNPDYGTWFTVAADVFQTSMISLMSPPLEPGTPAGETETYQERITREDVTRAFLDKLVAAQPAFLVLDFFADVHFGVARTSSGAYLTNNRWMLWPTEYYAGIKDSLTPLRIFADPDAYVATWVEAMDRFAELVRTRCPNTRVIVHRGLNTGEVVVPGTARPARLRALRRVHPINPDRGNELWARLDEHAITAYGWDSIDLRAEGYTSYAEHPWKPFYVHYTPDYNRRFLAELLARSLESELGEEDLAQVRAINASAHDRAAGEAERWTPVRHEQARRIEELSGLSVPAAARFAVGQRLRGLRGRAGRG